MSIIAYNAALTNFHEITHAIGLQMTWHYNDIGKISLTVSADDYNIHALEQNGMIYDVDRDVAYTIQNIKYDTANNRIDVNGYTVNWLLNKRAVTTKRTISNVEDLVRQVVTDNLRSLPNVMLGTDQGLSGATDAVLYGGELLDVIIPVLDRVEYGHRLRWDHNTGKLYFEVYQGNDLTSGIHAVTFSEEQGTAAELIITDDNSTFKNYFYLPCKLTNETEIVVTYGSATGGNRYEHWIDSGQVQSSDETETEFRQRMVWECQAEAAQRLRRQTFSVKIDADDLGYAYDLGDKIACASARFGIQFLARITGVKFTLDNSGPETLLILGEPQLTALGEVKLLGRN